MQCNEIITKEFLSTCEHRFQSSEVESRTNILRPTAYLNVMPASLNEAESLDNHVPVTQEDLAASSLNGESDFYEQYPTEENNFYVN